MSFGLAAGAPALLRGQDTTRTDSVSPPLASRFTLRGELLRRLPIDDARAALFLVPGVVSREFSWGVIGSGDASVRGGAPGGGGSGAAVYIDGAPARRELFGVEGMVPALGALEAVTVTTGVPDLRVGDAGAGVIAYETRAGGDRLAGDLRAETDEWFGDGATVGYNRLEGWVGGPVPRVPGLTWFASGTAQGQGSRYRGRGAADLPLFVTGGVDVVVPDTSGGVVTSTVLPRFVQYSGACGDLGGGGALGTEIRGNYGYDCQGLRLALDWSTAIRLHGKLAYRYGAGGAVSFTGLATGLQNRDFPANVIGNPALYTGSHAWSRLWIADWRHPLGLLGRAATVRANVSYGTNHDAAGLLSPDAEVDSRSPWLGLAFRSLTFTGSDVLPLPIDERIIRNIRTNTGLRTPYLDRNDLRNSQAGRSNPYGLQNLGWVTSGLDGDLLYVREQRAQGRVALEWAAGAGHRVTFGINVENVDGSKYTSALLRQAEMDAFIAERSRLGVFAGDQFSLGPLFGEVGLRYDRAGGGGLIPVTPGRTFSHPRYNQFYPNAGTDDAQYAAYLADTAIWRRVRPRTALSPRALLALPVGGATAVRVAYARMVEPAPLELVYHGTSNDLSFTSTNDVVGRDLGFAVVSLIEAGLIHRFGTGSRLEAIVYHRGGETFGSRILPFVEPRDPTDTINVNVFTRVDGPGRTGFDMRFAVGSGRPLEGALAYTFDRSSGRSTQQVAGSAGWTAPATSGAGLLRGVARGLSATATFRYTSGLPYTRLINNADGQTFGGVGPGIGGRAAEPLNASQLPWSSAFDMRLEKAWRVRGLDWAAYLDVRNLLNLRSQTDVFLETGTTSNAKFRDLLLDPERAGLNVEAQSVGALLPGGTVDLTGNCQAWAVPVNCESLRRVEARFGDGDGLLTTTEFDRSLNAYYEAFFGSWRFYQPGRTLRIGMTVGF